MTDADLVLVVDFGAQYAQLIARRVREARVYSEIVPHTITAEEIKARAPKAVILSGGPSSVYAEGAPQTPPVLFDGSVPVFGICYGFQAMTAALGGTVAHTGDREYGRTSLTVAEPGVLHGARSYLMQDEDGQTLDTHSISAGLDYPGVGPEHAWLRDEGRARYRGVSDTDAMEALGLLARTEGILCAIETAHAFAGARQWAAEQGPGKVVLISCSGRGDKDVDTAGRWFGHLA